MFRLGSSPPPTLEISTRTAVHLLALEDFCRQLPALDSKRAAIQSKRRVSDRELLPLFGDPFRLHEQGHYAEIAHTLIRDLEIAPLFTLTPEASAAPAPALPPIAVTTSAPAVQVQVADPTPSVSVIVLTVLGPTHLPDCLSSLRAQTYPADRREIIVVDNASRDDPMPAIREHYPDARVIRNPTNVGFSVGNNIGAKAATGEYVIFLNDDTRVHPDFLRELVGTAVRRRATSVGARILSWDGTQIDFVGGSVNCEGRGFQIDIGQPEAGRHTEERPLLFGCGGAMLARRDVFLDTGGWDEAAFAYYEDVEIGWRFWLLGHEVWFSPRAIVYHKHHGTWGRWPEPPRLRLYERNSMRILYTHLERTTLERVFPAALLLSMDRALLASDLSRAARDAQEVARDERAGLTAKPPRLREIVTDLKGALRARGVSKRDSVFTNLRRVGPRGLAGAARDALKGSSLPVAVSRRAALQIERGAAPYALDGRTETIPASAGAALSGVADLLNELPQLSERRAMLQSRRRRRDRDILSQFGLNWLHPAVSPHQLAHEEIHRHLMSALDIGALATRD
jgi:GT2 family glycosyltransferase